MWLMLALSVECSFLFLFLVGEAGVGFFPSSPARPLRATLHFRPFDRCVSQRALLGQVLSPAAPPSSAAPSCLGGIGVDSGSGRRKQEELEEGSRCQYHRHQYLRWKCWLSPCGVVRGLARGPRFRLGSVWVEVRWVGGRGESAHASVASRRRRREEEEGRVKGRV